MSLKDRDQADGGAIAGFKLQHFKRPLDQLGFVKVNFVVGPGNFDTLASSALRRSGGGPAKASDVPVVS